MPGIALLAALLWQSQAVERYQWIVLQGTDTTSIERVTRSPAELRAEVLVPGRARLNVVATTGPRGCVAGAGVTVFPWGYDLSGIDPAVFPIYSVQSMLDDGCGIQDCIQLVGYYQGGEISRVVNSDAMGVETPELPPAAPEAPYYDEAMLFGLAPFSFDHSWIMIIDP